MVFGNYFRTAGNCWLEYSPADVKTTQLSIIVGVVVLGLTLATVIGVDWYGFAPLLQLQLGRSWQLVVILAIIFGSDIIYSFLQEREWASFAHRNTSYRRHLLDQGKWNRWFPIQILLAGNLSRPDR